MDYTKTANIMKKEFIIEWNNLLKAFNDVLFSIPPKEELQVFILLINKINSNCLAAIDLINKNFINEGFMIFRSAIESIIYATYLKLYPEEQKEFIELSDFFLIKNQFIQYKDVKSNKILQTPDIQLWLQTIENTIRELLNNNELLRLKFPSGTINFTEKDVEILDKFFNDRNFKFTPQRVSYLLKKIIEKEPHFANISFNLHSIYYTYYAENSAILHGNVNYWREQPKLDEYYLEIVTSHLLRILIIATDLVKNEIPKDIYDNFGHAIKKLKDLEVKYFSTSSPEL